MKSSVRILFSFLLLLFCVSSFDAKALPILGNGTTSLDFTIDYDGLALGNQDIVLRFGSLFGESLTYQLQNSRFVLTDTLRVEGNFSAVGDGYIAQNHEATNSSGKVHLGKKDGTWQYLEWSDSDDAFEFSEDLHVLGDLDMNGNQISNMRLDLEAASPNCEAVLKGKIYFNTSENRVYVCNGSKWIYLHGHDQSATILPSEFQVYDDDIGESLVVVNTYYMLENGGAFVKERGGDGVFVQKSIPTGYKATKISIYTELDNAMVEVLSCSIFTGMCSVVATGMTNSEIDFPDIYASNNSYVLAKVQEVSGSEDSNRLYGGIINFEAD